MGCARELSSRPEDQMHLNFLQMIFEIIVLISTIWNFFVRPRTANVRLARALHQDGVTFFVVRPIYHLWINDEC